jgi:DNA-binding transcriptional ArsR family regulator
VLLSLSDLARIESGEIDLAFRRWKRPMHRAGGTQRTRIGVLAFDSVEKVAVSSITADDARRAGFATLAELKRFLARKQGADPRIALRERTDFTADERAAIERLPWARAYLTTIAEQPGVRAEDLAAQYGMPKRNFKQRVRRLKELGLTESLEVGYRISARGRAFLDS